MKTLKKNNLLIVVLFLVAILMSIGFAVLSTTLNINGQAVIKANTWDIHFENLKVIDGSITAITDAKIVDENATKVEYSIVLENPGDFYEFTVDAVNSGSSDSMIEVLTLSGLEGHEDYLNCQVTYLDGTEIKVYDTLNSKARKTYKVRVEYKTNMQGLPAEDQRINFSFSVIYSQAENGEFVDPMCSYEEGTTWEFTYTGSIQEFNVPCSGTYKLEVWGAQGGNASSRTGGKGGYSVGNITLNVDNNMYIVVGGAGLTATTSVKDGGYNGGGTASSRSAYYCGSGGGATHIATITGLLSELENNKEAILIVAGGGGGANYDSGTSSYGKNGGAGGGLSGISASRTENGSTFSATAGTQTSAGKNGSFGQGGNYAFTISSGGGGGYYGGGTNVHDNAPAAGGSGYIGGVIDGETIAGNLEMPTQDGTSTMTGNTGNGYAKITLVSY